MQMAHRLRCRCLYWDVVPDEYRQKVADNLAIDIQNRGLDVGFTRFKSDIRCA